MYYLLETVGGAQFDNTALELCQRNGKTESVEWLVSPLRVMHPRARASRVSNACEPHATPSLPPQTARTA